jgi:hypothetical protein
VRVLYWVDQALITGSANVDPAPFSVIVDEVGVLDPTKPNQLVATPAAKITTTTTTAAIAIHRPRRLERGWRLAVSSGFVALSAIAFYHLLFSTWKSMELAGWLGAPPADPRRTYESPCFLASAWVPSI